ncbi:MAG TPA: hypothetical protein VGS97_14540 [Actinocrinis sp.]|uniref:hypothetical protein n=1 Tax=Actinocrinis sp. TaxID=1920516 RepID=UPI002DDD25F2|nr:hypothetical protein [Actinocrinis sp.]HEV2345314.1 hypothetical protein [Actinocrinis sp.]
MAQSIDVEWPGRRQTVDLVRTRLKRRGVPAQAVPIVLLVGRRGTGKTQLLERLQREFGDRSPLAVIDFAHARDQSPHDVMLTVMRALSRRVRAVGVIPLPRLLLGLKTIEAQDGTLPTGPTPGLAEDVIGDLADLLPAGFLWARAVARLAVRLAYSISNRRRGVYLEWYKNELRTAAPENALPELRRLAGSNDDRIWRVLVAALLDDLAEDFNRFSLRHGRRLTNCLLTVDRAGAPAGRALLDAIAAERRGTREWGPDPLVVVAAQAVRPEQGIARSADPLFVMPELVEVERIDAVSRRVDAEMLLPLGKGLRFFGYDADRKAADYVGDLSEGHLASACLIAASLRSARAGEVARLLERPLSVSDAAPRPLYELIADGLLPDRTGREIQTLRRALPVYAAAFEPEQVAFDSVYRSGVEHGDVADSLDRLLLVEASGVRMYPLLRRALVRRLALDEGEWVRVHAAFRDHYRDAGHDLGFWYHSLALVRLDQGTALDELVGWLDGVLDLEPARKWHDDFLAPIASAPNRLAADRDPEDWVTQLAGPEIAGDRRRVVKRLLVTMWLHGDRDFDPTHRLAASAAHEYGALPRLRQGENRVFTERAAYYRNLANYWHPRGDV